MIINPYIAIENKWITFPNYITEAEREKYIQPNGIDVTIDEMRILDVQRTVVITEFDKQLPPARMLNSGDSGTFLLSPNTVYDIQSYFSLNLPSGVCANLIVRSTFSRSGARISNGLYDSGFNGNVGCTIISHGAHLLTARRTRFAQVYFMEAGASKLYDGSYNNQTGTHWSEATKS